MPDAVEDHPAWAAVRGVQATRGRELMLQFGAHGLDIAWVDSPDGRVPGLVFHVASTGRNASVSNMPDVYVPNVPDSIEVDTDDGPLVIPVRVVEAPETTFEE